MDEQTKRKYEHVLEILPDVAECSQGKLILVGGTALAVFYLRHRISVDLDFVPIKGEGVKLKGELKGCLTKKGYNTTVGAYKNQFVVRLKDTGIKVEIFEPKEKVKHTETRQIEKSNITIASLDDIFDMKIIAYSERRAPRDLFDIFCIMKFKKKSTRIVQELISKYGPLENIDEVLNMALDQSEIDEFKKEIS